MQNNKMSSFTWHQHTTHSSIVAWCRSDASRSASSSQPDGMQIWNKSLVCWEWFCWVKCPFHRTTSIHIFHSKFRIAFDAETPHQYASRLHLNEKLLLICPGHKWSGVALSAFVFSVPRAHFPFLPLKFSPTTNCLPLRRDIRKCAVEWDDFAMHP